MECFPKASGSAVILVKAMVSFGQMFYPMLVSYMLLNNIWYGYGLIIPGILFVLITLMLLKSKFPSQLVDASVANELPQMNSKPLVWLGRCFISTVRCSRILDLLCDCGVDAQICDGFCWYVRS